MESVLLTQLALRPCTHRVFVQTLSIFADVTRMGDFLYELEFA